ncbi:phage antirepressor [Blautia parvula]|uniref:Phage antirepressor Ant n=1 Tax=Blautia parvula TaxID=2877527 RepID=A0ABQ0C2C6_9FIRM
MNELKIFENAEFGQVRTVTIDNEPWFVGKDVAEALGYAKARNAIASHVSDEDKKDAPIQGTPGGTQTMTMINESGLYALIFGSKLEAAKRFKHWVTSEVLPAIRKHGAYAVDELLNNPDMAIKAFTALKEERERNKLLQADNARMKPKEIFADAVAASKQSILIGELAKLLKQNGYDTGEKRLFTYLRDNGYLIRRKGTDYNAPTQKSMEMGLFEVKETAVTHSDGHTTINKTTKITGKGQQYFINKFLDNSKRAV